MVDQTRRMITTSKKFASPRGLSMKGRHGYSLVEVIAAVFVLALAIGSSIVALRLGFGMVETARDQTVVSQFLQSEIETLRLKNWRDLEDLPAEESFRIHSSFDPSISERFACVRRIEDVRPGEYVKQITLQVTWKTSNGVDRELVFKTRISKEGLNDYYYRSL